MTGYSGRAVFWLGLLTIAAGLAASAHPAQAQQDLQRIAAIVNDDIISFFDLNARVEFMIASTGAPNTPETHKRFQQQVLKTLIDERLQKQEAGKNNIKVTEQEVSRQFDKLEKENNMPKGGLDEYLKRINMPRSVLVTQIESTLAWQKLIQRKLRPRLDIGDDEVEETLKRIEANRGLPEQHVAEIFLTEIVHRHRFTWKAEVEQLHGALLVHGPAALQRSLAVAGEQHLYAAHHVLTLLPQGGR